MKRLLAGLLFGLATLACAAGLPDRITFLNALERGDMAQARAWLDEGLPPDFSGAQIGNGLMIGAWEGNIALMALFLSRGVDVNAVNALGETALLHASWKGHLEAVRWLVAQGAQINPSGKAWSALHYAAFAGHGQVLEYLLQQGASPDARSPNGSTPLMMAAREGRDKIATALLAAGADISVTNDAGEDAVRWAMRNNNVFIAREIVGSKKFAALAERPAESWGRAQRSQQVSEQVDALLANARKMMAAGKKDAASKLYREALTALRKAGDMNVQNTKLPGQKAPAAATGLVISAQRYNPDQQTAGLQYATPGAGPVRGAALDAGGRSVANSATPGDATDDSAQAWLQRGRALEAAGRRKEAFAAYARAAALLR
jgi:hypothetical protein